MVYYLGSKPTLGHYANTKLLDGDPRRIEVADMTPDAGFNRHTAKSYRATQGRPIRTEHVPTRIEWQENAPVPDVTTEHGMLVVSERFREVVERFEPGVHQFLPVAYLDRRGDHIAQRFYFIACNRLDSVDREHTVMVLYKGMRWTPAQDFVRTGQLDEIPAGFDVDAKPKVVFNKAQIGDKHAWSDMFLTRSGPELSDALAEALEQEGFSGLSLEEEEAI